MPWNLDSDRPIFAQIVDKMMDDIFSGKNPPGSQLQSVRDLAIDASVNPNTMQRALSELERTGLVYSKRTSGRFVTEDAELISRMKHKRARDRIDAFLAEMANSGISKGDIINILSMKGEEK